MERRQQRLASPTYAKRLEYLIRRNLSRITGLKISETTFGLVVPGLLSRLVRVEAGEESLNEPRSILRRQLQHFGLELIDRHGGPPSGIILDDTADARPGAMSRTVVPETNAL